MKKSARMKKSAKNADEKPMIKSRRSGEDIFSMCSASCGFVSIFLFLYFSGLFLPHSGKNHIVAVAAIQQRTVHTADGGG